MPTHRVRVVPPFRGHRLLGLTLLLASLCGAGAALAFEPIAYWASAWGLTSLPLLLATALAPFLVCGVGFAVLVTRLTHRPWWLAGLSAVFWAMMTLASEVTVAIVAANAGMGLPTMTAVGLWFGATAVAGLFGGLAGLGVRWADRALFSTVKEHSGPCCWRCGYDTGSERIATCPECGRPIDPLRFRGMWLLRTIAMGQRVGWIGVAVLVAGAVVWTAANWSSRIAPTEQFIRRMSVFGKIEPGFYFPPGAPLLSGGTSCLAARLPLVPARAIDVLVVQVPGAARGGTAMQLQASRVCERLPDDVVVTSLGVPRILCDLNEAHARYVLASGVPDSLLQALRSRAGVHDWNGGAGTSVPADLRIDPAPHFPQQ